MTNPFPKTTIDEGIEVSNDKYRNWEQGYKAGMKEGVRWIVTEYNLLDSNEYKRVKVKLKRLGIEL